MGKENLNKPISRLKLLTLNKNKRRFNRSLRNINRNLYKDNKIMSNNEGAFVAGAIGAGLGMGSGAKFKSKVKVEKPKGQVVKGNTDSLTGKIVAPEKSEKEKKAIKRQAIEKMEKSLIGASKDFAKQQKQKPKKAKSKKLGGMNLSPKADLDGDGKFSEYEKTRGSAIQKAMNEKPIQANEGTFVRGTGIAIKGTKFKGVF